MVLLLPAVIGGAQPLRVFLIPHSHCDAGWLKTFDDYYNSEVSKILPSMLTALAHDSTLRFNWAETGFLRKWWTGNASATQQALMKQLVLEKRIELIGGGWVL